MMKREPAGASGFLTRGNLRAIGQNLQRSYPIDHAPCFDGLLAAIDEAARRTRRR